ncbi:hypothetical protein QQ054_29470 [Oscillatoria amoena NRMC-F 0135]|nr:hypothetical protein [Oscillatoria amoena NRMC-F 0135]
MKTFHSLIVKSSLLMAILTILSACKQRPVELTDVERKSIEEEIRTITNSIFESANRKDPDQLYSNFSSRTNGIFSGSIMESWEEHRVQGRNFFCKSE